VRQCGRGGRARLGTIAISGGYTQGVNGTLLIEVGGTAADSSIDSL
jgi:hypothetical protein